MSKKVVFIVLLAVATLIMGGLMSRWLFTADGAGDGHMHSADDGGDGGATNVTAADWCAEHAVPESVCTICNPALINSFKEKNDWCAPHELPESHCRLCNPEIRFPQETAEIGLTTVKSYESPQVLLRPNKLTCATDNAIIQFSSHETARRTGIETTPAVQSVSAYTVEAPGEVVFDETRQTAITIPLDATIIQWLAEPGQRVSPGTSLALLESPEMAALQSEYLQSVAESGPAELRLARADSLVNQKHISRAEYETIEAEATGALSHKRGIAGQLRAAGLQESDIKQLETSKDVSSRWIARSTGQGVLIDRKASLGARLNAGALIAMAADPDQLWIEAHLPERYASSIAKGQSVEFNIEGEIVGAKVIWVAQFVDPETRTITVRAEPLQQTNSLIANKYGTVRMLEQADAPAVSVPKDAIQWEGCCNVVFVRETAERYRPRKVSLVRGDRNNYQVTSGLKPGEEVVVRGSFLLKTELMKSSLGAGCCGIDAKS